MWKLTAALLLVVCRILCADPGVVIVMPLHNGEDTLAMSIQSVRDQSYPHWDLWIIDDASTDNSVEVARRWARLDSRIHVHSLENNVGPGQARNIGSMVGRRDHKYVAFLDDDDIWAPRKLERQVGFMEETGALFSYTAYRRLSLDGMESSQALKIPARLSYHTLLTKCPIATAAVMLNIEKIGLVDFPAARLGEDLRYWLNLTKSGVEGLGLDEPLVYIRRGGRTISANKWRMIGVRWEILRKVEKLSLPVAGYYFLQYAFRSLVKYRLGYKLTQMCPAEIAALEPGVRASPFFTSDQIASIAQAE